ncbi:unnamed protein product [Brachionus calyciflorus]|uniref:Uncharacterized protein n=1 Tax=Brachionus calyciflorus TaxID=104777 RepID=A0A813PWN3_9BILA|nr:unnamed protein product [Brachionus calyciflorus]
MKSCLCDQTEYNLIRKLFEDYDPSIRPSVNHNYTLNVTFGVALTQLIDVDERNMIITTNCWLNQNWIDNKLKWNPEDYDFIKSIHIPAERIWKPDILLVNNADSWAKISSISTNAFVKYDGNVTWLSTVIFKSSCSINVRYFPFDEQVCDMIFASWTFDGFLIDINVNSNEGDTTNYIKNGEWHLVKLTATKNLKHYSCCEEPYPEIYVRLVIRRRPLYYVFNMVFPCLLITLVAFLGFFLPPGSTEKVSMGITTLLSITVYLMLVAESMPPTSEQLPLLGIYYAVTIGIVSLSTCMAVVTLNINNKGIQGKRVPKIVRVIFFEYLNKIVRDNLYRKNKSCIYRDRSKSNQEDKIQLNNSRNESFNSSNFMNFNKNQKLNKNDSRSEIAYLNENTLCFQNQPRICLSKLNGSISDEKNFSKSIDQQNNYRKMSSQKATKLSEFEFLSELEKILVKQFNPLIKLIIGTINVQDENVREKKRLQIIQNEWSDVAVITDQILCYLFCFLTLASCLLIFLNSPHFLSEW